MNTNRILKNTIFLYIRMFLVLVISFYCSRIVLKVLGETDFGLFNVVGGLVAMMSVITSSMALAIQRYLNIYLGKNDLEQYKKTFSNAIFIQLVLSFIIILVGESAGLWFLNYKMIIPSDRLFATNMIYQTTLFIFIINLFTTPLTAVLISHEQMTYYALLCIVQSLLKLGFVLLLFYEITDDRLIAYGVGLLIIDAIVFILNVLCVKKVDSSLSFKMSFDKKLFKSMMHFSGWSLFGALAFAMKGNGLNILLNMFFGPTVNAARGIAYQVSGGAESLYQNFQIAVRPQIMKSYSQKDIEGMNYLVYFMSKISFFLLWVVSLPILFLTDPLLSLWLGSFPEKTIFFTQLVIIISLVGCFGNPLTTIVHATGKMKNFQIITGSVLLLIVPIAYIFLKLGCAPESAFIVSLIITFVVQIVRLVLVNRLVYFPLRTYFANVILPCLLVVVTSFFPALLISHYTNHFLILLFSSTFLSAMAIIGVGLNSHERRRTIELITKKLKLQSHNQ